MAVSGKATFSILGPDVAVKGDIRASADLHIDGHVEGDIACAALVQGAESRIKGSIMARSARLAGHIEGSITVGELLIEASARIAGDVTYKDITVAGRPIDGRFSHRRGAGANATASATAELKLVTTQAASAGSGTA